MYSKKNLDRRINVSSQYNVLGPLNYDKSVFIISNNAEDASKRKTYLMKVIPVNH